MTASFRSINRLLLPLLLLLSLACNYHLLSRRKDQEEGRRAQPVKLRFAIQRLEEMVERDRQSSGLSMEDIKAAYSEPLDYSTWRKLAAQKVFDLFYDLNDYIQSNKPSSILPDSLKPTTIEEFEVWYRKLRPFYLKAALIELDRIMKEMEELDQKERQFAGHLLE